MRRETASTMTTILNTIIALSDGSQEWISLETYLVALDPEDALRCETVMYCGRDGSTDFLGMRKYLAEKTDSLTEGPGNSVQTMLSKMPLSEYLRRGMEYAKLERFDLESWTATNEGSVKK